LKRLFEEPYAGKPHVRFREGRTEKSDSVYSTKIASLARPFSKGLHGYGFSHLLRIPVSKCPLRGGGRPEGQGMDSPRRGETCEAGDFPHGSYGRRYPSDAHFRDSVTHHSIRTVHPSRFARAAPVRSDSRQFVRRFAPSNCVRCHLKGPRIPLAAAPHPSCAFGAALLQGPAWLWMVSHCAGTVKMISFSVSCKRNL
jgi:hypothetical protein